MRIIAPVAVVFLVLPASNRLFGKPTTGTMP